MNFWKKKIKKENINAIANKMGVEENKIKELINGDREVEGQTLDKLLDSINENKIDNSLKKVEILQWYKDADLKQLRKKFGYKSQMELAKKLKIDNGTLSRFEVKKYDLKMVTPTLEKLYYFYNNDFNRKSKKVEIPVIDKNINVDIDEKVFEWYKETNIKELRENENVTLTDRAKEMNLPISSLNDIENHRTQKYTKNMKIVYNFYHKKQETQEVENNKEIWEWYKNTNIINLRKNVYNISQYELANVIGKSQPSVADTENKKIKSVSPTLKAMYKFFNSQESKEIKEEKDNLDEIYKWYMSIDDLREFGRNFGYSKNKLMSALNLSWDQARDLEGHKYKSATPIVCKLYEFYHNENNRLPEIKINENLKNRWNKKEEQKVEVVEELPYTIIESNEEKQKVEVKEANINYEEMYNNLLEEFNHQREKLLESHSENYKLKMQIARYEKLIDRL